MPRMFESDHWLLRAACREADPSIFYPAKLGRPRNSQFDPREYCERCPVTVKCLERALSNPIGVDRGIWAGTNQSQRRKLRNQRIQARS